MYNVDICEKRSVRNERYAGYTEVIGNTLIEYDADTDEFHTITEKPDGDMVEAVFLGQFVAIHWANVAQRLYGG
jgi:hypothetical protein